MTLSSSPARKRTHTPPPASDEVPSLKLPEVAEMLGFSERGVRKMVAQQRLSAYRIGRQLRFKRSDVMALFRPIGG